MHRRHILRLCGVAGFGTIAGCFDSAPAAQTPTDSATPSPTATHQESTPTATSTDSPAPQPDFDGFLNPVSNFDGTVVDARGRETVTVTVGTTGNGGPYAFDPPALHVDTGTTVKWEWTGEGGGHTVTSVDDRPLNAGDPVAESGINYEYTFGSDGIYKYVCRPHEALEMKGAVVVGTDYPTMADEQFSDIQPDFGDFLDDAGNFTGRVVDARGQDTATVAVGAPSNVGNYAFDPPALHVDTGTTIRWEWTGEGGAHTVVSADDGPLDAGSPVADDGVNYEYTFESDGIYNYVCEPHQSLGMKGSLVVGTDYPRR